MAHLIKYTLLFFVLIVGFQSYAQEVGISGKVLNEEGEPIESVTVQIDGTNQIYVTSEEGFFQFQVAPNATYLIRFTQGKITTRKKFIVGVTDLRGLVVTLGGRTLDIVDVVSVRTGDFIESFPQLELNRIASPSQNFEDIIKVVGLGVNSSNELTSNYNVRGGNYDENLIYVNGIEIYRPFLARSGQQEGLSFINPAFVNNIFFSSGGFDSYYGDKLSSILDIRYRQPTEFGGSGEVSLMGAQAHIEGCFDGNRGSYITGARYRVNSYLLNSLPTKGDYNPTFFDYQFLTNYYLKFDSRADYVKIFALGHFSTNNYLFEPQSRTTSWGTVNEAYQLRVFFEGQEETKFQTFTAATGLESMRRDKLKMTFIASVFRSVESERFDILGEYLINELETDPSKEDFGDSTANVGIGGLLDHARNELDVWIGSVYHDGKYSFPTKKNVDNNKNKGSELYWGVKFQLESFQDHLSEWNLIDSAGYSVPTGSPNLVELKEVIKQDNFIESSTSSGYFQFSRNVVKTKQIQIELKRTIKKDSTQTIIYYNDTIDSPSKLNFSIGTRAGYRSYNGESWLTPRASITYSPRVYLLSEDSTLIRRNVKFRLASGLYYQPPLYRTMRDIYGGINPDIVSQKSWHNVIGADVFFNLWGRPFKFITEAYYKYMWDVVPYEVDNVRIRYYGENSAVAYAYGVDAKINGEFVPGVESFFRVGYLNTKEDLLNDFYYTYFNSDGDTIKPGYTFNNVATDSTYTEPGYIRRPTDQRLTFSVFFQDKMPKFENLKVSVNLTLGTPLPYGPPTYERYKDILSTKSYFRVDLGFMYDIINSTKFEKYADKRILKHFEQMTVSLDAFNLLGVNNVVSYQWLQDIAGRYYAIPNNLTGRRINLRFIVRF